MGKKALALAATAVMGVSGVLAASPASASVKYVPGGGYTQSAGPLNCIGHVYNGGLPSGDGTGALGVEVRATEFRLSSTHFRTARVATRIIAQEKNYFGVWKNVATSKAAIGHLGPARNAGKYNVARVRWGGDYSPFLTINVNGFDDLYRAKIVSRFYNDEGNLIARLVDRRGQCQL